MKIRGLESCGSILLKHLQACKSVPCTLGLGSWQVPTLHPYPHPSRLASWHQDRECSQTYPSPDNIIQSKLKAETDPALPHRWYETESNLRFGVRLIVDPGAVVPVLRFLGFGVLDLLRGQEVPVLLQRARLHLLVVNLHLVRLIRIQDQCVQVSQFIILGRKREISFRQLVLKCQFHSMTIIL